jgi:hypothetical protein
MTGLVYACGFLVFYVCLWGLVRPALERRIEGRRQRQIERDVREALTGDWVPAERCVPDMGVSPCLEWLPGGEVAAVERECRAIAAQLSAKGGRV